MKEIQKTKQLKFYIDEADERVLSAVASTENPDRDHDILKSEGWQLDEYTDNPVLLFGHKSDEPPVAKVTDIEKAGNRLEFKARFPKQGVYPFADTIYELYKEGFMKAFSVRFSSNDYERNDEGGMTFNKAKLLEISAVTVPANAEALVQQVKNHKNIKRGDEEMADTKATETKTEMQELKDELKALKEIVEAKKEVHMPDEITQFIEKSTKDLEEKQKKVEEKLAELKKAEDKQTADKEKEDDDMKKAEKDAQDKDIGKIKKAPPVVKKHTDETRVKEFFTAMLDRDYIALKDLSEGTDKYGGYLVPEEFRNQVLQIMGDGGVARREGTLINMSRDTLNIPKLTTKPSVNWVSESSQISTGDPEFGQVALTAKKAALIVPTSTELFEDSAVNIQPILSGMFAEKLAEAEDYQAFAGDGTVFTGILNDGDVNTVTMGSGDTSFDNVALNDIFNLMASVKQSVARNGKFFMDRTIWSVIKNLTDTNGNYVFNPTDQTLLGYPVVFADDMNAYSDDGISTVMMGFGDMSNIYIGDRRQMSVALADQATVGSTNLYEKDMLALRVTERVAIAIALSGAFGLLKTAAA